MKRLVLLLLSLVVMGCGSSTSLVPVTSSVNTGTVGRNALLVAEGPDVVALIDALPVVESDFIYRTIATWSDSDIRLRGTALEAFDAVGTIVRHPAFSAHDLFLMLDRLSPDNGQGFVHIFGDNLAFQDDSSVARAGDALTALLSDTNVVSRNVEPILLANLPPEISSIQEFHGLRILSPAFYTPGKKAGMLAARDLVPNAQSGEVIRKIIKVADMQNYLNGNFDPEVSGFVAVANQTEFLRTPEQYIAGLRLDYEGGFQGETQVSALSFPQTAEFELFPPFSPPMDGVIVQPYPFTGTGFTSNVQAQAIPEFHMPLGPRTPLPVGSQLFLILEDGTSQLQGTLNAQGVWEPGNGILTRREARETVRRSGLYKEVPVWVSSTDGTEYWVASAGQPLPQGFFREMSQIGPQEYVGRVLMSDPDLTISP